MTAALVFIASCLIGVLIIEIRAWALDLSHYTDCAKCNANQSESDNSKQKNIHLVISSDEPMKHRSA